MKKEGGAKVFLLGGTEGRGAHRMGRGMGVSVSNVSKSRRSGEDD